MILYRNMHFAFHGVKTADARGHRWYTRLAKLRGSRFCHVSAFYYDSAFDIWQVIEWTPQGLFFGAWNSDLLDMYLAIIHENDGRILQLRTRENPKPLVIPPFGFYYCVTGAKHLANIRGWTITPDQLFGALLKAGAHASFTSLIPEGAPDDSSFLVPEDPRQRS